MGMQPHSPSTGWIPPGSITSLEANGSLQAQWARRPWRGAKPPPLGWEKERCMPLHGELLHGGACRGAFHELWQVPVLKDTYQ